MRANIVLAVADLVLNMEIFIIYSTPYTSTRMNFTKVGDIEIQCTRARALHNKWSFGKSQAQTVDYYFWNWISYERMCFAERYVSAVDR